jgi:hypothetical protein
MAAGVVLALHRDAEVASRAGLATTAIAWVLAASDCIDDFCVDAKTARATGGSRVHAAAAAAAAAAPSSVDRPLGVDPRTIRGWQRHVLSRTTVHFRIVGGVHTSGPLIDTAGRLIDDAVEGSRAIKATSTVDRNRAIEQRGFTAVHHALAGSFRLA